MEVSLEPKLLSDSQYQKIAPLLPGKSGDPGRAGTDNRKFVEAVLWIVRTGAPWRDLPAGLGRWNSAFRRFRRWSQKGIFEKIFNALSGDPDFEYAIVDGTIVRVHQHGTGAKGGLKIGPLAARGEAWPRKSWPSRTRLAMCPASPSCPASGTILLALSP